MGKIEKLTQIQHLLEQKKMIELQKQFPVEFMKAQQGLPNIHNRPDVDKKSMLIDPYQFNSAMGYKDKPLSLSYGLLQNMAKTPIINAVIRTRVTQIASFSEPQDSKYTTGYVIQKRNKDEKVTKQEQVEIERITRFMSDCGANQSWHGDDFDSFLKKVSRDSLIFDQMNFEVITTRKGEPFEFYAVDAKTVRISDSFDDDAYRKHRQSQYDKKQEIAGYFPSYVQIYQGQMRAEFYPWEMCFGVRNATSDMSSNGYGLSELEEMVNIITALLWGEEYNRRFFKQGGNPKGMLKVSGNMGETRLQEFRQQWNATINGVWNAHRTPIVEADKIDWVDMQKSNKDMEFNRWIEYLIKIACAIYQIDPAEVNFPLSGGSEGQSMFEGSNEARLKHSKDKGLYPILKSMQKWMNKYIVARFYGGKYVFRFVGLDSQTPDQELDFDNKALNVMTLNEVRAKRGLKPVDGGDIVLNGTFTSWLSMSSQLPTPIASPETEQQPAAEEQAPAEESNQEEQENPFTKAFNSFAGKLY